MIKQDVTRNLIGLEDLALGVGTVQQRRGPIGTATIPITKINGANLPYDANTTLKQKFDGLEARMDTLPPVVDQDGNLLTGLINTSVQQLNLTGRLWRKDLGATALLYYGTELLFEYDKTNGNIVIPPDTNYIAADNLIIQQYTAADQVINATITALLNALKSAAYLDVGVGANNVVQLDSAGRMPQVDGSLLTNLNAGVPVGFIGLVGHSIADVNWLECNGQAISRATYSLLFSKVGTSYGIGDGSTTFNLPDLRGVFVRGWNGAVTGTDPNRVLGSTQQDSIKAHSHAAGTLVTSIAPNHSHTIEREGSGQGGTRPALANVGVSTAPLLSNTSSAGSHSHTVTGSTASTGDGETRPINTALKYIIKVA